MSGLGDRLREARESQDITLVQAEAETRIRRTFLQALEEDRYEDLPGNVYARGFVRNYARFLGLDSQELLAAYAAEVGVTRAKIPHVLDEPLIPRSRPHLGATLFVVIMLASILGLAGWYAYNRLYLGIDPLPTRIAPIASPTPMIRPTTQSSGAAPIETVTLLAAAPTSPPEKAIASPTMKMAAPPVVASTTTSPTREAPATIPSAPTEEPTSPATPTSQPTSTSTRSIAVPVPLFTPTQRPRPTPIGGIRVEAKLVARAYLDVSVDGEQVFVGIREQGEDEAWEARSEISLRIGNAAGVELTVNSVPVGPLGETNEVIIVEYTLANLP